MEKVSLLKCPYCLAEKTIEETDLFCKKCGHKLVDYFDNNADKLFNIGLVYDNDNDIERAILFYQRSSKLGNSNAMYRLGKLYLDNQNIDDNKKYPYYLYCIFNSALLGNTDAIKEIYTKINLEKVSFTGVLRKFVKNKLVEIVEEYKTYIRQKEDEMVLNGDAIALPSIGEAKLDNGNLDFKNFEEATILDYDSVYNEENKHLKLTIEDLKKQIQKCKDSIINEKEFSLPYSAYDDVYFQIQSDREHNRLQYDNINKYKKYISTPYIFRLILKKENGDLMNCYIGEESFSNIDGVMVVFSWASELGNRVYDDYNVVFKEKGHRYSLELKRRFDIRDSQLISFDEIFNARNGNKFNTALGDEYLKRVLNAKKPSKELKNIISTIQYEQNQIITSATGKNLIMQGVAGSGKTEILFHRIKYLLVNEYGKENGIYVITPNSRFNNYVKPLLEDLNITKISVADIYQCYINIINIYTDYKFKDLLNGNLQYKNRELSFNKISIKADELLSDDITNYYYKELFDKIMLLDNVKIESISALSKIKNHITDGKLNILEALLGKKEQDLLPKYKRIPGVIYKCELFALCLFYYRRCGYHSYGSTTNGYDISSMLAKKYIFIDEAQDLSYDEYKFLHTIFNKGQSKFNLFGDINQSIYSYSINDWNLLTGVLGDTNSYIYKKNYRNTKQVVEYVNSALGYEIESVGVTGKEVKTIKYDQLDDCMFMPQDDYAIICSLSVKKQIIGDFPKLETNVYNVATIKGMEFKKVFVVLKNLTQQEKYIALTRSLNDLVIVEE